MEVADLLAGERREADATAGKWFCIPDARDLDAVRGSQGPAEAQTRLDFLRKIDWVHIHSLRDVCFLNLVEARSGVEPTVVSTGFAGRTIRFSGNGNQERGCGY